MKEFLKKLKRCLGWQYLQEKSEYGFSASERGFMTVALDNASILADELGLDEDLAQVFALLRGIFFPPYGQAGLRAVMEYIKEHGYAFTEQQLAVEYVLYDVRDSGIHFPENLLPCLEELFSEKALSSENAELRLGAICYQMAQRVKPFSLRSQECYAQKEEECFQRLKAECLQRGEPVWLEEFDHLDSPCVATQLSEEEKRLVFDNIDFYIKSEEDVAKGIFFLIMVGTFTQEDEEEEE